MTPDENEVATCDDHLQILRHKLESLILKHTNSWHGISRLPSKIPWCWIPSSAIIESIMLPRRLSSSFPRTKSSYFYLRKSPPSPGDFWLASGAGRNVITFAYLFDVTSDNVGLIQIRFSTAATVSSVSEKQFSVVVFLSFFPPNKYFFNLHLITLLLPFLPD